MRRTAAVSRVTSSCTEIPRSAASVFSRSTSLTTFAFAPACMTMELLTGFMTAARLDFAFAFFATLGEFSASLGPAGRRSRSSMREL